MKWIVAIKETTSTHIEIEAPTAQEALRAVKEMDPSERAAKQDPGDFSVRFFRPTAVKE